MPIPIRASRRNIRADIDPLLSYFGGGGYGSAPSADLIRLFDKSVLTLAGDAVTVTLNYHIIAAEAGVTDDLATINGGDTGWLLAIAADTGDTITVKDGTGNIEISGGYDIDLAGDRVLLLIYDGTNWIDIGPGTYTEGPGIDIADGTGIGLGLDSVLLVHGDGTPAAEYATLTLAIAAAAGGDTIWLAPGTYPDDQAIPDGVTVAGLSSLTAVLTGQITLGNNGLGADDPPGLSDVRVNRTANDGNALKGVIAPATGGCRIVRTFVSCVQAGAGVSYAASVENAGDLEAFACMLFASSGGGAKWGGYRTASGNLYVLHTSVPMAAPFNE